MRQLVGSFLKTLTISPRFSLAQFSLPIRLAGTSVEPLQDPILPNYEEDKFSLNTKVTVQQLFQSRFHLGHKHGTSNQLMRRYIWGIRSGCHIFDLNISLAHLKRALTIAGLVAERNGIILFVNSRSQFDRLVRETAQDCGEYVVSPRWRPGTFTNSHMTINTHTLPDLLILLSTATNPITLREAAMCNIPTIGLSDSDCDPRLVTYNVPGNDDTPDSVQLYCQLFSEVIKTAKMNRKND